VSLGFVAALGLTVLAVARVDVSHGFKLSYRQGQQYEAAATLFVTQPGFPWGRTVPQYLPGNSATAQPSVPVADADRLASLTALYAQLATSDAIRKRLPGVDGVITKVTVTPVSAPPYVNPAILPMLTVAATTTTPSAAIALANRATDIFHAWLEARQTAASIPVAERVSLEVVDRPTKAKLTGHRSKTLPFVIFLGLMAATFGVVFVLENLDPRVRVVEEDEDQVAAGAQPSRLAS
jgi:capsular polysaccharide biosynthesis protein